MAGVFRFANPVSGIDKFIDTYRSLYAHFYPQTQERIYFGHTEAYKFLATQGLASSLGAIGQEAIKRSEREDSSRDPLFNQHKMYSELYRMLGWYEPGSKKTNFNIPEYGEYIAEFDLKTAAKLFTLNVLHIVSPNPLTSIKGGNILRPFPMILKMMDALDGYLYRDEMILTVLACPNDRDEGYVDTAAAMIRQLRSEGKESLQKVIKRLKAAVGINSDDVLPNYTRFPIAVMKWTGWADSVSCKKYYNQKSLTYLKLTDKGKKVLDELNKAIDIRYEDLLHYTREEQAAFTIWSNLYQLKKAGFDTSEYGEVIQHLEEIAYNIFADFNIHSFPDLLFFGYQEAPRDILKIGNKIIGE